MSLVAGVSWGQFSVVSCSGGNIPGKNLVGPQVQGAITLEGISRRQLSWGKLFRDNYPGDKSRGELGGIVLEGILYWTIIQGVIIQG